VSREGEGKGKEGKGREGKARGREALGTGFLTDNFWLRHCLKRSFS